MWGERKNTSCLQECINKIRSKDMKVKESRNLSIT